MLSEKIVNKPVMMIIIFILVTGLGLYSISRLAIDLFPEISPPILLVITNYGGAGPEEVENTVTRPLEGVLGNVRNIESMVSTSSEGTSQIRINFTWGTDMSEASNNVRDMLELSKAMMPEDAAPPTIFKFDPSLFPILQLSVVGNRPPEDLRDLAERIIVPRLEQVEGVALASINGGRQKAIMVEIPQNRLEAYDLTLSQVANVLRGQNIQISGGSISEGNFNYLIKTAGQFKSLQELLDTVVAYKGNPPRSIRLRDFALVYEGLKREEGEVFINGVSGVEISIQKQSGTNSVVTADNVVERIARIQRELPTGVALKVITDTTVIIRSSLGQVIDSVTQGAIFAVLILLIFLRNTKSTVIIAVAIPISVVITLATLYFLGLTLNIMTLSGLALGIGMLVDNSIVILENIYRYREKGTKLKAAAILGTQEMIGAITASTLTTICVFAPMLLFQKELGIMGELFKGLALSVVVSLASSLLVAVFLVPVLSSKYFAIYTRTQKPLPKFLRGPDTAIEGFFLGLDNLYRKSLRWVLGHRKTTLATVLLLVVVSVFFATSSGLELLPAQGQDTIQVNVELPVGTRLEVTKDIMLQLETRAKGDIKGYVNIITSAGGRATMGLGAVRNNKGTLRITLPPFADRIDDSDAIKEKLRAYFTDYPSAVFAFSQGGQGLNTSPIDILIKSQDLQKSTEAALKITEILKDLPGVSEPVADLRQGLPEIELFIDREKAYSLGLNLFGIGQEIRANIDGVNASKFRAGSKDLDIVVTLDPKDKLVTADLNRIFVVSPFGSRIPLSSVATQKPSTGPVDIIRENQTRTLHVRANIRPGFRLDEVTEQIRMSIDRELVKDEAVVIDFSGDFAELLKYIFQFALVMLIAVFLVFGVMASQFESFLDPFIILFTIPLTVIGVVFVNVVTGESMSLFTVVGMIILAGVVVNNGIVLVDYTNLLRRRGMSILEACVEAGGNRLRPILMTTLTTILGLIPMAFFGGEGSSLVQPIGKTIVGGLATSTFLTLFIVPVLFSYFNSWSDKRKARRQAREAIHLEYTRQKRLERKEV